MKIKHLELKIIFILCIIFYGALDIFGLPKILGSSGVIYHLTWMIKVSLISTFAYILWKYLQELPRYSYCYYKLRVVPVNTTKPPLFIKLGYLEHLFFEALDDLGESIIFYPLSNFLNTLKILLLALITALSWRFCPEVHQSFTISWICAMSVFITIICYEK